MKTWITLPACVAGAVLKSLQQNLIICQYMGLDQSGRLIMDIQFKSGQSGLIKELTEYIDACEKIMAECSIALNKALEAEHKKFQQHLDDFSKRNSNRIQLDKNPNYGTEPK